MGLIAAIAGVAVCSYALFTYKWPEIAMRDVQSINDIGHALIGMEKFQYLLPFEAVSVLLLACIIGAIMIARKR